MTVFVLPMMHPVTYELSDHFAVGANIEQTWQFFSTATNLPLITPPWLNFTIDMPDGVEIRKDTLLHYRIRAMGMVMKWESKILEWEPPRRFVDLQTRGPYKLWWHEHRFEPDPLTGGVV